jgi:hypothetical protein
MDKAKPKLDKNSSTKVDVQTPVDAETILLTLDQIGQTIDVMNKVVGRLRGYVNTHLTQQADEAADTRVLH